MLSLTIAAEPDEEPITVSDVKSQLRITTTDEDVYLKHLIGAARKHVETILGRALITQTWDLYLNRFPCYDREAIQLLKPPLQSITHINYFDNDDIEQTWYRYENLVDTDSYYGIIYPGRNYSYPATRDFPKSVNVRFIAGYGDSAADVPDDIKQDILLVIGHFERNKEAKTGITVSEIRMG